MSPAYTLTQLKEMLLILGEAPDSQLDKWFAKRLQEDIPETQEEVLNLIRNLLDECVFCAGASSLVLIMLRQMLEGYPESDEAKASRRAELEKKYGLG